MKGARSTDLVVDETPATRRPWWFVAVCVLVLGACSGSSDGSADRAPTASATSSAEDGAALAARVERVADALGVAAGPAAFPAIQVSATGSTRVGHEGPLPEDLVDTSTYETDYLLDLSAGRVWAQTRAEALFESFETLPPREFTVVADERHGLLTGDAGLVPVGPLPAYYTAALVRQQRLFTPHVFVAAALDEPGIVTDAGALTIDGRPHRALLIADAGGDVELHVDDETGLVTRMISAESNPLVRDVEVEVTYSDWTPQGALVVPSNVELSVDGAVWWSETRNAVDVDPPPDETLFDALDEATAADADPADTAFGSRSQHLMTSFFSIGIVYDPEPDILEPVEILPGVTHLPSRASSLVVAHPDGLIVLEAPASPANGTALLEAIDDLAPGQAVTHLVQSHHHVDHAAGVRSFAAAGATVVVGDGAGAFWEEVLDADSSVEPDALSTTDDVGALDEVAAGSSTVIMDDGDTVVTVHHTPTPHASDMLITTIETGDEIVVYEADTYNATTGFTLALPGPQVLFDDLRSLGYLDGACASPVPMTIVPAHGAPQSLEESLAELTMLGIDVGCS